MKKYVSGIFFFILIFSSPLSAVTTTIWKNSEYTDFEGGKLTNVSIGEDGIVRPTQPLEKLGGFGFDSVIAISKLDNEFYIATIGPNGIFKFFPNKKEKNTEKTWTSTDEIVTDLTAFNDKLYFSTIPKGNLYEVDDGKINKVASFDSKFLWKLYPSEKKLYVTTGEPGGIFEIDSKNKLTKLYSHEKMHFKPILRLKRKKSRKPRK